MALLAKQYRRAAAFLDAKYVRMHDRAHERPAISTHIPHTHAPTINQPHSPIYEVDPKATGLSSADLLRHFHHAGLVYAALGRFADAFDAFKTVRGVRMGLRKGPVGRTDGLTEPAIIPPNPTPIRQPPPPTPTPRP